MRPTLALYTHWPAAMGKHELFTNADGSLVCLRCEKTFASPTEAEQPLEGQSVLQCQAGCGYPCDREVVDDLTEKKVKYPGGGFLRATPVRVKGAF
jgi:hypothetical protein